MSNYEIIYIITIFIKMKENIFIYFYISVQKKIQGKEIWK